MPLRTVQCQQREDRLQNFWGSGSSNLWQGSGPNPDTVNGETEGSRKGTLKKEKGLISMRLRYWRDRAWSQGTDVLGASYR